MLTAAAPHTMEELARLLGGYLSEGQIKKVEKAYLYAERQHRGEMRLSGEPYITHPLAVAGILSEMGADVDSLSAAILHDVIENTDSKKENLSEKFGQTVADLVDGVSKIDSVETASHREAQALNLHKIVITMAKDARVMLIKLADRLHNMRTLEALDREKRKKIAQETLEIYAPMARRLGVDEWRVELEDLCFRWLHPMRSQLIRSAMRASLKAKKRDALMETVAQQIKKGLREAGIEAQVIGREKNPYDVYKKMRQRHLSFSEIMDLLGFRIVVNETDECYSALGVVHNIYKPLHDRFRDHIAMPKRNGYQSLHTVLVGMHGIRLEVQIRTRAMDKVANYGVASHDFYKLGDEEGDLKSHFLVRSWIKNLLDLPQARNQPEQLLENLRSDMFPDEIYVFTPRGDVIKLPRGATPVDFAYTIHSDVGNHCISCTVDGEPTPLSTPLLSGQTVEIQTAKTSLSNPSWLNFVTTERARTHIRHNLKKKEHNEGVSLGRQLLESSLNNLDSSLQKVGDARRDKYVKKLGAGSFEDVLFKIGIGDLLAPLVARQLAGEVQNTESWWRGLFGIGIRSRHQPLTIDGTEGMVMQFGHCCSPIPGDDIMGYVNPGKGLVVHTKNCKNLSTMKRKEECFSLAWTGEVEGEFAVRLQVTVRQKRGMLAELVNTANDMDINVKSIQVEERDGSASMLNLDLYVKGRVHLAQFIRKIRRRKNVVKVVRKQS